MAYQHLDEYCKCMKEIHEKKLNEESTIEDIVNILLDEYYENQELFETFCRVNAEPIDESSLYFICESFYKRQASNFKSLTNISLDNLYEITSRQLINDLHHNRSIDSNTITDFNHLFNEILYKKGYKTEDIAEITGLDIETITKIRSGKILLSLDELLYLAFSLNFTLDEYTLLANDFPNNSHRKKSFEACIASRTFIKRWENNESLPDEQLINAFLANQPEQPLTLRFSHTKDNNNSRNLLIVGASGFIGSNAALYFKDRFDKVVLFHHSHRENDSFPCYSGDCQDAALMEEILLAENITHVLFLAGYSVVSDAEKNREEAIKNGSAIVVPLLGRIVANKLNDQITVLAPSTVQIYEAAYKGEYDTDKRLDCHENVALPGCYINNTYALTKINMETNIWRYLKLGCKIGIPRLANVYGPNDIDKRLIPIVIKNLRAGKNPQVKYDQYTKRPQRLSFIHIDDCLKALDLIFTYYDSLDEFKAQDVIFNIAGDEPISVEDIVKKLCEFVNPNVQIEYGYGRYDTRNLIISTEKIKKLGFKATVDFYEGLEEICHPERKARTPKLTLSDSKENSHGK